MHTDNFGQHSPHRDGQFCWTATFQLCIESIGLTLHTETVSPHSQHRVGNFCWTATFQLCIESIGLTLHTETVSPHLQHRVGSSCWTATFQLCIENIGLTPQRQSAWTEDHRVAHFGWRQFKRFQIKSQTCLNQLFRKVHTFQICEIFFPNVIFLNQSKWLKVSNGRPW